MSKIRVLRYLPVLGCMQDFCSLQFRHVGCDHLDLNIAVQTEELEKSQGFVSPCSPNNRVRTNNDCIANRPSMHQTKEERKGLQSFSVTGNENSKSVERLYRCSTDRNTILLYPVWTYPIPISSPRIPPVLSMSKSAIQQIPKR